MQHSKTINGVGPWSTKISRSPNRRNIRWTDMKRVIVFTCLLALLSPLTSRGSDDTELIYAAKEGDILKVKNLLAEGADVNARDKDGITALMVASRVGQIEMVRELQARGADVNAKDNHGGTALMYATDEGGIEVVRELLANDAYVNVKADDGTQAQKQEEKEGKRRIAQFLKKAGER